MHKFAETLARPKVYDNINKIYAEKIEDVKNMSLKEKLLNPYEFDVAIGMRTSELSNSAPTFISKGKLTINNNMELRKVAIEELMEGKLPYIIKRPLPNGTYKYIRISDMDVTGVSHLM